MEKKKNEKKTEQRIPELKVVRELLDAKTKSGDEMYGYVLRYNTMVNGKEREIRVDFASQKKDLAGYDMLDMIFMDGDEAFLDIHEEIMTDEKTKEERRYTVHEIWNVDEDGITYSYKVRPMRESDKAKLSIILQKRALELQKAAEAVPETPPQNKKE